jgi:hypothetical protein
MLVKRPNAGVDWAPFNKIAGIANGYDTSSVSAWWPAADRKPDI